MRKITHSLEKPHPNQKHGESHYGKKSTKEYRTWMHIRQRCRPSNKDVPMYARWAGRGIKLCKRWNDSYLNFLADMGRAPSPKHTIERRNNDGDYEPSNCSWELNSVQQANRIDTIRITYKGETMCLKNWCRKLNINYKTAWYCMRRRNMSFEQTVSHSCD